MKAPPLPNDLPKVPVSIVISSDKSKLKPFPSVPKIKANQEWGINLLISSKKWKKEILRNLSYPVKGESQILSIIVGQEEKAILLQKHLEKNGFLAIAIRPPTVPLNESRIRLTIRRDLNLDILNNFISVLKTFK